MRRGRIPKFELTVSFSCATLAFVLACKSAPEPKPQEPAWKAQLDASIAAFKNRKRYAELTPEILATISDSDVELAILDLIDCRVESSGTSEREVLNILPVGFRTVHATWLVEAEVNNGGFNQYFWNSGGEFAEDAVQGFDLMGVPALARLTERAIAIRARDAARMAAFKQRDTIEAFSESYEGNPLNELDEEFYNLEDGLSQARVRFIRKNPELFRGRCEAG
jgi:hypothetical protein